MKYAKIPTYKYRLLADEITPLSIAFSGYSASTEFMALSGCRLLLKKGYAWDGATGGLDTKDIMRASLVHDALCQLIWMGVLPTSRQNDADRELCRICKEDGVPDWMANCMYHAVRAYSYFKKNPAEPRVFETERKAE